MRVIVSLCLMSVVTGMFSATANAVGCATPEITSSFQVEYDIAESRNLLLAAWLGLVSQMRQEQFEKELVKAPFQIRSFQPLTSKQLGYQGALIESDTFNVLLFRGTDDLADGLLDADFLVAQGQAYGLPGGVTRGAAKGFLSLWPHIKASLDAIRAVEKPLFMVGHSLGGVLAQYSAVRLLEGGYDIKGVYGFAAPVAGDVDFAKAYNDTLKQVTFVSSYGMDITPHVPPLVESGIDFLAAVPGVIRGMGAEILRRARYADVGRYFMHGANGMPIVEVVDRKAVESEYWRTVSAKGVPLPFLFLKERALIRDHWMDNYLCSLAPLAH